MAGFAVAVVVAAIVAGIILIGRGQVKTGAAILVVIAVWLVGSALLLNVGVTSSGYTGHPQVVQRH